MKRFLDKPYFSYSLYNQEVLVKCSICGGQGVVKQDERTLATFVCKNCLHKKEKSLVIYKYAVHNDCTNCGVTYRVEIEDESKQNYKNLFVNCPRCNFLQQGKVQKVKQKYYYGYNILKGGKDPHFGLELWYLDNFKDGVIWALNLEHLEYLISYISADLRESPHGFEMSKTQSDHLPTFMKEAKNREAILKKLSKMKGT